MPNPNTPLQRANSLTQFFDDEAANGSFSTLVLCDLSPIGPGLAGVKVGVPRSGLERDRVNAFIQYCRTRGTDHAVSLDDFQLRLGTEIHHLLVMPGAHREAFLGAVVVYSLGALGLYPMPGLTVHPGENWAHHLARHAVSGAGMAISNETESIKLWERFAALSAMGFRLDVSTAFAPSPLSVAIRENNVLALEAMLSAGATLCAAPNGWHPIHEAAASGADGALRALLGAGQDINAPGPAGESPLHLAARNGHLSTLCLLLAEPAVNKDARRKDGATAAYLATKYGQVEVLRRLVDAGANIELGLDANGQTPLCLAASIDHLELVDLLLDFKARIDPLPTASRGPLQVAAAEGHIPVVHRLLDRGANIDASAQNGETALMLAANRGHDNIVKLLLERGADLEKPNSRGVTPLHAAALSGSENSLVMLLEKGASINARTVDSLTALHLAARWNRVGVCALLLDHGANLEAQATLALTPLHAAAAAGHVETLEFLLDRGAQIDAQATGGATALYAASKRGETTAVMTLLARGANPTIRAGNGTASPLSIAAINGFLGVTLALLQYAHQLSAQELLDCHTLAHEHGHQEVAALISAAIRARPDAELLL